jgi:hypothetical protein
MVTFVVLLHDTLKIKFDRKLCTSLLDYFDSKFLNSARNYKFWNSDNRQGFQGKSPLSVE